MKNDRSLQFRSSPDYTLGVEIEFQIIDRNDFSLMPFGPKLQELAPEILQSRISQELIKSILEIQTGICRDMRDVKNDLLQTISLAEELAAENDCLLYSASLHPFARAESQERNTDARYQDILAELQIVARRFISQGLHIHVGVPDGEAAVRICNTLQGFLPLFLALSTSSPYFQGEDTGLMSYRTKLFEALPLAGVYEFMQDWSHFVQDVETLKCHGIINGVRDLWWDTRPSPQFGTIEVRICDLPSSFRDILTLASLIQAVVVWINEERIHTPRLNPYLIRANKWQAVRHGVKGKFVDPTHLLAREQVTIAKGVELLLRKVSTYGKQLNSRAYLNGVSKMVARGTSADNQRRIYQQTGDFKEVVRTCQREFWD